VFQTLVSLAIGAVHVDEATGAPAPDEVGHPVGVSPLACPAQRTTGMRTASSRTQRHKVGLSIANPRFAHPCSGCRYRSPPRCDPDHSQPNSSDTTTESYAQR